MDTVLVLGACGFTGKHFQAFVRDNHLLSSFDFVWVDKAIEFSVAGAHIITDLRNPEEVASLLLRTAPDYILNFAGIYGGWDFREMLLLNAELPRFIMDAIVNSGLALKKLLLVGSAAEYGFADHLPISEEAPLQPFSPYGLSKAVQSQYACFYSRIFRIPVVVARTFNVIGAGLPSVLSLGSFAQQIHRAKDDDTIFVGNLDARRDYLDVSDVVSAYWKLLLHGKQGDIYNVCRGQSARMGDLLGLFITCSGKRINVSIDASRIRAIDLPDSFGDNAKLRQQVAWEPKVSLLDAVNLLFV